MNSISSKTSNAENVRRRLEDLNVAVGQLLRENGELQRERRSDGSNNRPKLTKRDVQRVREMKRNGCSQKDIADCLDVSPSTICRTLKGVYHK